MSVPMILGVAADMFGCGFHRIQCPAAWIAQSGAGLANVTMGYPPIDKIKEMGLTAIVCQRPKEDAEIKALARIREDHGDSIKIIYEIDDLLSDVPDENVHESFQPPPDEVDEHIQTALSYCDWAVVPTLPLKTWLQKLKPDLEVKVIPNYLPELDGPDLPKISAKQEGVKARIGWGGSISHDGDLDIITKAVEELETDDFTWVFLGHQPRADLSGKDVEFHTGVAPVEYLPLLMRQGIELILAPLEDNNFNDAKSNLRLIQAGAIGAAVIASPIGPYVRDNPPVFAYASTPEEFKAEIERWLALPEKKKIWHRARMRNWAKKTFGVKANLSSICNAWGIANGRIGEDKKSKKVSAGLVINAKKESVSVGKWEKLALFEPDTVKAVKLAVKENMPMLSIADGAVISDVGLEILIDSLKSDVTIASVCGMTNDSGVGISFLAPQGRPAYVPLDTESNKVCEKVCLESGLAARHLAFPLGPVVLMSPKALAKFPKPGKYTWDWGFLAAINGMKNLFVPQVWSYAPQPTECPTMAWIEVRGLNFQAVQQSLSVEERVKLECAFIRGSKSYLIGNGPGDSATWTEVFYPQDPSVAAKSVKVITLGHEYDLNEIEETWVRFEANGLDLRLGADAYMEIIGDANIHADIVYCDALAPNGSHFFKPPLFDKEWFLGVDYLSACSLIRTQALKALSPPKLVNRAQVFGVMLELIRQGAALVHCPVPLYYEKETLDDDVRLGMIKHLFPDYSGKQLVQGALQVWRKPETLPSVTLIILTTGKTWTLRQGLATLLKRTEYAGEWNVLLGRAGERKGDPTKLAEVSNPKIKLIELGEGEFNWSKSNNQLAAQATGDVLIFLNDDVLVTDKHWLDHVIGQVQRETVGAVGIRLFFPGNGNLQHAGVYVGNGVAGHISKNTPGNWPGYWGYGRITHECSAVTGAMLAITADKFARVGGFDERMAVNYSDVDLCLKVLKLGYRNICVCSAEMMHAESSSRPLAMTGKWVEQIGREGKQLAANHPNFVDPYWNPNFKVPVSPNNWSIGGLNWDVLKWEMPWRGARLILNDNDGELIIRSAWEWLKPIVAMVEKGRLTFIKPTLTNIPAVEIIEKSLIRDLFTNLGVSSIVGKGVETEEGKILLECLEPEKVSSSVAGALALIQDNVPKQN